ncbi:MAG: hypothetical protein AAB263_05305 [Planctomycetota bacterium]
MSTLWRTGCVVLALVAIAQQVALAEEGADPAASPAVVPASEPDAGLPIHGYLSSRYVVRTRSGAGDQDLTETLSLTIGDPARHRVTLHVFGDVSMDLDGNTSNRGANPYDSARDSSGSAFVSHIYSLYLDINRVGSLSIFRVGRQSIYDTPETAFFDGVRVETAELGRNRVTVGAYGGIAVRLYEDYGSRDLLGGVYTTGRLWQGSRARVDWEHLEGHNGTHEFQNNLIGVSGWQRIGRSVDVHARYTRLDDADRDVLVRSSLTKPEWDLRLQASFYQMLESRRDAVASESDAYYPILKDYVPYREYRGLASKGFGDHLNVDVGVDVRRLTHGEQAGTYNHEFERYFATLDILDVGVKGSSISLTQEQWISANRRTAAQGLDITCPVAERGKVSVGTAHYLYKYDTATDQERDDVQSYYARLAYIHSPALRWNVKYNYETSDSDSDSSSAHDNELRCEVICTF